jgi:hypothetical protein
MSSPDWRTLGSRYPESWLRWLERNSNDARAINTTASKLASHEVSPADRERFTPLLAAAESLLQELADIGWLSTASIRTCPICGFELDADYEGDTCPNPDEPSHAFTDQGAQGTITTEVYNRAGIERRHVAWMLALHGMNTLAPWQESFNWLVSTSYGRMVPVRIYKYGKIRPGVLWRRRHRTLMERLAANIRRSVDEVARIVDDPRPDVIAHSFGTLLLGKALHRDRTLRVGRIITLGCILRPDFDWATLVDRGQIEAVLNNYGTHDSWAQRAHATIPDAGPAGRRGFDYYAEKWSDGLRESDDRVVFNVPATGFTHSQFFDNRGDSPTTLERQFTELWQPFLTTREVAEIAPRLLNAGQEIVWPSDRWKPHRWPLRAITGGWGKAEATYADPLMGN